MSCFSFEIILYCMCDLCNDREIKLCLSLWECNQTIFAVVWVLIIIIKTRNLMFTHVCRAAGVNIRGILILFFIIVKSLFEYELLIVRKRNNWNADKWEHIFDCTGCSLTSRDIYNYPSTTINHDIVFMMQWISLLLQ